MKNDRHSRFSIFLIVFLPVLTAAFFYFDRVKFLGLLSFYGLLSVGRIAFQVITAAMVSHRKYKNSWRPKVSIIVATFNEDPTTYERSIRSLMQQNYPDFEVIIIDDGSDNADSNREIAHQLGARYYYQDNAGKREAMYNAFGQLDFDSRIVLTADSDTIWQPSAAAELVKVLLSSPEIGAVTGYVGVLNAKDNFLTRMVDQRYYMAFQQERASQAMFGTVTCVSGPLGAYRRSVINKIKDDFISQRFMGKACTFGDDRHLTNLVLGLGYQVQYAPLAICLSEAPTTIRGYLKQQTRWGKSHWREMIWQWKALPYQPFFLSYDWLLSLLMPFMLVASLASYGLALINGHAQYLLTLIVMMVSMSLLRTLEPIRRTRNPWFLLFTIYTLFHVIVLLPLKFWALFTMLDTRWGTRVKAEQL